MNTSDNNLPPRDRIIQTAADLFYRNGYRATGVNEVIDKAGVAKATFYSHFPSKDALCLAYLQARHVAEARTLMDFVNQYDGPRERFLAVIDAMEPWAIRHDFRGCPFLNLVPEVPEPLTDMRQEGREHYDALRGLVHQLTDELLASDPKRYGHLHAADLRESYMMLLVGAVAMTAIYSDLWPIQDAQRAVRRLIDA